jgi:hypothetical protein
MGIRPFAGPQTVTGAAQPVFGTALTAAVTPPPDEFSGKLTPGSNETQTTLIVTSTKGFITGDRVAVGPTAAFNPGLVATGSIPDQGTVKKIVDATHLIVQGLKNSHAATGEWVVLNEAAGDVRIRSATAAGTMYIGNASTVSATDASVFEVLNPGNLFDTAPIGSTQPWQLSTFWLFGAAADTFVAAFSQV